MNQKERAKLEQQKITASPKEIAMLHKWRALPPAIQDIVTELVDSEYRKAAPRLIILAGQETRSST